MLETAFKFFNEPVTYLEVIAFVLAVACVACNAFRFTIAWPLTIASSALYAWLFFHSKLFGEAGLQILFIVMAVWGWWQWLAKIEGLKLAVSKMRARYWPWLIVAWLASWGALGAFLQKFTSSDVPFWDAFPTAGSVIATVLLARKHIENWPIWILINSISIGLFAYKKLWLTAFLYAIFAAMAVWGWRVWSRALISKSKNTPQIAP